MTTPRPLDDEMAILNATARPPRAPRIFISGMLDFDKRCTLSQAHQFNKLLKALALSGVRLSLFDNLAYRVDGNDDQLAAFEAAMGSTN